MKKHISKRLISVFLIVTMLCTMVPFTAMSVFAEAQSGYDEGTNTYYIATKDDLIAFRDMVNVDGNTSVNGVLTADIDLNPGYVFGATSSLKSLNWACYTGVIESGPEARYNWTPIGLSDGDNSYCGNFDGQGHTIRGIHTTKSMGSDEPRVSLGLFGRVTGGSIKNVKLENSIASSYCQPAAQSSALSVSKSDRTYSEQCEASGMLVGLIEVTDTTVEISNIDVSDSMVVSNAYDGGVIGCVNTNSTGTKTGVNVSNCNVDWNVDVAWPTIYGSFGGIVGFSFSGNDLNTFLNIDNCGVSGILGTGSKISYYGGIMSFASTGQTNISDCTVDMLINGSSSCAPILSCANKETNVNNCINRQQVAGYSGLVASTREGTTLNIDNCFNYGDVIFTSNYVSGLVGEVSTNCRVSVKNSANTGNITTSNSKYYCGGLVGYLGDGSSVEIENCANTGKITGGYMIGGLVGYTYNNGPIKIKNSYNTGDIEGLYTSSSAFGNSGLVGYVRNSALTVENCYSIGKVSGKSPSSIAEINTNSTYSGNNVYYLEGSATYDVLLYTSTALTPNTGYPVENIAGNYGISKMNFDKSIWYADDNITSCNPVYNDDGKIISVETHGTPTYPSLKVLKGKVEPTSAGNVTLTKEPETELVGYQSDVSGKVTQKAYVTLSNDITETSWNNAYVKLTYPEGNGQTREDGTLTKDLQIKNLTMTTSADGSSSLFVVPINVSAKEMTQGITAEFYDGNSSVPVETLTVDTVKSYADAILGGSFADNTKTMVKKMLNYGANAQLYFSYHTDDLANKELSEADKVLSDKSAVATVVANDGYALSGVGSAGEKYYGSALSLESDLVVKHYFQLPKGYVGTPTATGSNIVYQGMNGNLFEVDVKVNVKTINQTSTINVNGATLTYSPFTYIKKALASSSTSEELKNVCVALYDFYKSAQ